MTELRETVTEVLIHDDHDTLNSGTAIIGPVEMGEIVRDMRPSDAIALALVANTRILVESDFFDLSIESR